MLQAILPGPALAPPADAPAQLHAVVDAGLRFDLEFYLCQRAGAGDLAPEFRDFREPPDDGLDRGGEHVVPADDEHVVDPAQNTALQPREPPPAGAPAARHPHAVPGAVTDQRAAPAAEVRQDQLALRAPRAFRDGLVCEKLSYVKG